jgi:hypothetical protein
MSRPTCPRCEKYPVMAERDICALCWYWETQVPKAGESVA